MGILREKWQKTERFFSKKFADGETMDIDGILFLIGIQELGFGVQEYKKDDKMNLMHLAVCRLLVPYGYYEFTDKDEQGWPHYTLMKELPQLKPNEQGLLMKEAIIQYMEEQELI